MSLAFGIIGCGLVGQKRARALGPHRLVACADVRFEQAQQLAGGLAGCHATADYKELIADSTIEAVIVATPHDLLSQVALDALSAGKHVLLEKPAGRSAVELQALEADARRRQRVLRVGYNHRFHPSLQQAKQLVAGGEYGPVLYVRGRYGHGGRLGYEREWRADPGKSGGGELLDQGSHLIDLARWFLGDFVRIQGYLATYFWSMPVEDNAFALLTTSAGSTALLHASWTEWKNLFCFEIFCREAKLQIDGLGGSYGSERLTLYRMLPAMGPPETTTWDYPDQDPSWAAEIEDFAAAVRGQPSQGADLADGIAVLRVIDRLYEQARR